MITYHKKITAKRCTPRAWISDFLFRCIFVAIIVISNSLAIFVQRFLCAFFAFTELKLFSNTSKWWKRKKNENETRHKSVLNAFCNKINLTTISFGHVSYTHFCCCAVVPSLMRFLCSTMCSLKKRTMPELWKRVFVCWSQSSGELLRIFFGESNLSRRRSSRRN